ncbi:hypothetical protein EVAR_20578_1 [Eumeta japonica]|uniref:Uncharacterized protein n=1 Tax=Eumeta variegata TaxID=151549 RepID=A0A4C1UT98_EUMVA|nr:hypothetical protein EVAR_20578_1 [Eumeta japonica]
MTDFASYSTSRGVIKFRGRHDTAIAMTQLYVNCRGVFGKTKAFISARSASENVSTGSKKKKIQFTQRRLVECKIKILAVVAAAAAPASAWRGRGRLQLRVSTRRQFELSPVTGRHYDARVGKSPYILFLLVTSLGLRVSTGDGDYPFTDGSPVRLPRRLCYEEKNLCDLRSKKVYRKTISDRPQRSSGEHFTPLRNSRRPRSASARRSPSDWRWTVAE